MALASNVLHLVPTLPLNPVLVPCIDLSLEKECRIVSGETPRSLPLSHSALSLLPSSPLTGSTSGSMFTTRSTIRFGQAMIQPHYPCITSCRLCLLQEALACQGACTSNGMEVSRGPFTPLSKPPLQSSWEDLNNAEPTIDLTELNEDETFTPHKGSSSRLKEAHGSLK